jgi:hypothetical protein|tara:strand:+ start:1942 stop:2154 length:213 start_codon:yes stop_codon:yes gene_type:complete
MSEDLGRKNELELVKIQGELKILSERIETIKTNDLHHVQKSLDLITKILWGVGVLILGQLAVGVRLALFG